MAFNFSQVFTATNSLFGAAGTYYDAAGTATTLSGTSCAILSAPRGALATEAGVLIPEGDVDVEILQTAVPARPSRGARYYDGTTTWDLVGEPSEDSSRLVWVMPAKRRA